MRSLLAGGGRDPIVCAARPRGRKPVDNAFDGGDTSSMVVMVEVVGTRPRRWLVGVTLGLGLAAAVLVTATADPADRTFAAVSGPMQSLMSILVPFIGVLLVQGRS